MAATIMQYPSSINHEKLCLQMGGDGKPVSLQIEGKVVGLEKTTTTTVDLKNPRVQTVGAWAVSEHNRKTGQNLVFVCVIGGWKIDIDDLGMKWKVLYHIYIEAKNKGVPKIYEGVVMEHPDRKNPIEMHWNLFPSGEIVLKS